MCTAFICCKHVEVAFNVDHICVVIDNTVWTISCVGSGSCDLINICMGSPTEWPDGIPQQS